MARDEGLTSATVVAAHASVERPGSDSRAGKLDVTLDVHRGSDPPERVQLSGVELGQVVPLMGSIVRVDRRPDGEWEIRWRGDPNLDVEAHRRELAALARRAPRRHDRMP